MFSSVQTLPTRHKRGANRCVRRSALVALAALSITGFAMGSEAGAAILQPFRVSPSAGPIGTLVSVSGTACSPGATVSSAQDRVIVSSTTFPLTMAFPTSSNGSWSGSFRVPGDAHALPGLIEATCLTDGSPSTTTVYAPQTFTVTSGGGATAGPTTPPVSNAPGGATNPPAGSGSGSNGGTAAPGSGGSIGNGSNGSGSNAGSGANGGGSSGANLGVGSGTVKTAAGRAGLVASAARAKKAKASALSSGTNHHFPWWILWLVLVALVAGALGLVAGRRRDHHVVETAPVTPLT